MKTILIIVVAILAMVKVAQAECYESNNKIKEQFIYVLENIDPQKWISPHMGYLEYTKTLHNKNMEIAISSSGSLFINSFIIRLSPDQHSRIQRLYKKIFSCKVPREIVLIKEFLEIT
jgi:hypothetical protein